MCPSDPQTQYTGTIFGWTNYHSKLRQAGSASNKQWDGVFGPAEAVNLSCFPTAQCRSTLVQITDGTSNTAAMAGSLPWSKRSRSAGRSSHRLFRRRQPADHLDCRGPGLYRDAELPHRHRRAPHRGWTTLPRLSLGAKAPSGRSGYNHLQTPNNPCWSVMGDDWRQLITPRPAASIPAASTSCSPTAPSTSSPMESTPPPGLLWAHAQAMKIWT